MSFFMVQRDTQTWAIREANVLKVKQNMTSEEKPTFPGILHIIARKLYLGTQDTSRT